MYTSFSIVFLYDVTHHRCDLVNQVYDATEYKNAREHIPISDVTRKSFFIVYFSWDTQAHYEFQMRKYPMEARHIFPHHTLEFKGNILVIAWV